LSNEGFPRTLVVGCAVAFAGVVEIGLATGLGAALCPLLAIAFSCSSVRQMVPVGIQCHHHRGVS
jgi:hypothetical protein